jgi:hypothetical protein
LIEISTVVPAIPPFSFIWSRASSVAFAIDAPIGLSDGAGARTPIVIVSGRLPPELFEPEPLALPDPPLPPPPLPEPPDPPDLPPPEPPSLGFAWQPASARPAPVAPAALRKVRQRTGRSSL